MHRNVEHARNITPPPVVSRNAVGVRGLNGPEQVGAHEIPAVVLLTKSLQLTVGEFHGLQFGKKRSSGTIAGERQESMRAFDTWLRRRRTSA